MFLFDTNIFLEILLERDHASSCVGVLKGLTAEKQGWVTSFSLHSLEVILDRAKKKDLLAQFLKAFSQDALLLRYDTTVEEELEIARLTAELPLDFDDTVQYFVAKKKDLTLVTLDRDFQKISGIRVQSPNLFES